MSPSISATTLVLWNWQRFIGFSNIRAHRRIFLQAFSHHLAWLINLKRLFNVSPSCFDDCSAISTISCSFLSFDSWKQRIERWLWCRRDDLNNGEGQQITRAIQQRLLSIYWLGSLSPSAHWPNSRTATTNATTDDQRQQAVPLIVVVAADFVEQHIPTTLLHLISLLRSRLYSIRDQAHDCLSKCMTILGKRCFKFIVEELIADIQRDYRHSVRRHTILIDISS